MSSLPEVGNGQNSSVNQLFCEKRQYSLNKSEAIVKKIQAINRDDFVVEYTGGGIKFILSTGMYELFKAETRRYFNNQPTHDFSYVNSSAADQQELEVETRYRAYKHHQHLYTLNLYHTRCTCLLNGKHTDHFMSINLAEIMLNIKAGLQAENVTLNEISGMLEYWLLQCRNSNVEVQTPRNGSSNIHHKKTRDEHYPAICTISSDLPGNQECETEPKTVIQTTDVEQPDRTDIALEEMETFKQEVHQQLQTMTNQITRIFDELTSIKKSNTMLNQTTHVDIGELSSIVMNLGTKMDKLSTDTNRRFQSLSDQIQSQKPHASTTSTNYDHKQKRPERSTQTNVSTPDVRPDNRNDVPIRRPRSSIKTKTLLIGSSILKGINTKGLDQHVLVSTNRGAHLQDIRQRLERMDLSEVKRVIVYGGGNDIAAGRSVNTVSAEYEDLVRFIHGNGCEAVTCTLCPRADIDTVFLNEDIKSFAANGNYKCIDCYTAFVTGDNKTVQYFYMRDGIHLSKPGTSQLLRQIHATEHVLKSQRGIEQPMNGTTFHGPGHVTSRRTGYRPQQLQTSPNEHYQTFIPTPNHNHNTTHRPNPSHRPIPTQRPNSIYRPNPTHRPKPTHRPNPTHSPNPTHRPNPINRLGCSMCGLTNHVTRFCRWART